MYMSVCLSVCLSLCLNVCLSVCLLLFQCCVSSEGAGEAVCMSVSLYV